VYGVLADASALSALVGKADVADRAAGAEFSGGTCLIIDQHGVPGDWHDHVNANCPVFYLEPLTAHFSQ
jgi:hypothetical protein